MHQFRYIDFTLEMGPNFSIKKTPLSEHTAAPYFNNKLWNRVL
jgi:hypothetical protein